MTRHPNRPSNRQRHHDDASLAPLAGSAGLPERVSRLEAGLDHLQQGQNDLRQQLQDTRAELKADVRDLRDQLLSIRTTDFRILYGALATVALGLAGLMAKGFHWL